MNSNKVLGMVATLVTALALSSSALAQEAAAAPATTEGGGGSGSSIITDGGVVDMWRLGGDVHMLFGNGGARGGLRAFADFPLHQFFMLGGEFNLAGGHNATQFQFDVKPTGRIPMKVGSGVLEPYITVPMGLGVWTNGIGAGFAWNVLFGCAYFFNDFIGVHGDLGVGGVTTGGFGGGGAFQLNLGAEFLF